MDVVCRLGEAAETRDLLGRQLIQMENLQVRKLKFNMCIRKIYSESHRIRFKHRYTEITHGPLLFNVAQGIF
jgi:hypothetical protein